MKHKALFAGQMKSIISQFFVVNSRHFSFSLLFCIFARYKVAANSKRQIVNSER